MAGQKIGTAHGRPPSGCRPCLFLPEVFAEPVEELARRVRTPVERQRERRNPFVVLAELRLARVRVVHPIDALACNAASSSRGEPT